MKDQKSYFTDSAIFHRLESLENGSGETILLRNLQI